MTAQPKSVIKGYFETGDKPTQAQFADLIDSYLDVSAATNGTVTSAGLIMPDIFAVTGSPITSAGNFTVTLSAQAQRSVLAAPVSANGAPVFRTLIGSDIPDGSLASTKLISTGVSAGTYASPTIIVNAQGQITSATAGSSGQIKTTTTISASANVTFSSLDFQNNTYEFHFYNIVPATDAANFQIDISENNFSSSADTHVTATGTSSGGTFDTIGGENKNLLKSIDNAQTLPYNQLHGQVLLSQLQTGQGIAGIYSATARNSANTSPVIMSGQIGSVTNPATFYNAVRFQMSAGNLTSGTITMIRKPIS